MFFYFDILISLFFFYESIYFFYLFIIVDINPLTLNAIFNWCCWCLQNRRNNWTVLYSKITRLFISIHPKKIEWQTSNRKNLKETCISWARTYPVYLRFRVHIWSKVILFLQTFVWKHAYNLTSTMIVCRWVCVANDSEIHGKREKCITCMSIRCSKCEKM